MVKLQRPMHCHRVYGIHDTVCMCSGESLFDRKYSAYGSDAQSIPEGSNNNDHGVSLLDTCIESLKIEIGNVDASILDAVRRQSRSGSNARERLLAAHTTIREAMFQVSECKKMAEESETMANDICKDIRQLDNAKKNLTTAINALRRLSMLIEAVDQLQIAAEKRNFKDAGHLLGAVKQLQSHFAAYAHIAKIAELRGRVRALEQALRLASLREFELLGEDAPPSHVVQILKDCCVVTGAIGSGARDELIDIICRREMNMYTQIFGTVGETAKLERTVNRYKWFIRRLDSRSVIWGIFPEEWRVTQLLALKYCSITKSELAEILSDAEPEMLAKDIDGLLKAVEATNVFEAEMSRRFSDQDDGPLGREDEDDDDGFFSSKYDPSIGSNISTADAMRKKYLAKVPSHSPKSASKSQMEEKRALMEDAAEAAVKHASFKNAISPVFEPYMFLYTEDVMQTLSHKLEASVVTETWVQMSDDQMILKSSDNLTSMIREELKHCSTKISKKEPLLELSKVFEKLYRSYASALTSKLPKTSAGQTTGIASIGNTSWHIKISADDIRIICLIIRTSDHCISMIEQLKKAIEKRIDPALKGQIDLAPAEDAFNDVTTYSLSVLLLGVETQLDIPLSVMMRSNWQAFDMTGDQSDFTGQACSIISDTGRRIRPPTLSPNYFKYFCDKLIRSFAPRLFDAVFRCGPIRQAGGQQLRLDLEALKGAIVSMAKEGSFLGGRQGSPSKSTQVNDGASIETRNETSWSESYARDVSLAFKVTESVLKVVSSPFGTVVDTFTELMPGASQADLQHILELMGAKKADMNIVLEEFSRRTQSSLSPKAGHPRSKPLPAPMLGTSMNSNSFSLPPGAAAKASAAAQDMASHISRIKSTANAQAAKLSAAMKSQSNIRFNK